MRLSKLQKYILDRCFYTKKGILGKRELINFYSLNDIEKKRKKIMDTIHKSIEALVKTDLLVAFGHKTAKKWFIHKIKITRRGKKLIKGLIKNMQGKLPIK
jgi:hypothetical protein